MAMDLSQLAAPEAAVFALSDMMCCRSYRLELLDAVSSPLPLDQVVVEQYNLLIGGIYLADFDVQLTPATGALRVHNAHDGGGNYTHSGFVTFSNLPAGIQNVRVTSDSLGTQPTEGVHFYLAIQVPEPGAGLLGAASFAVLAALRRWRALAATPSSGRGLTSAAGAAQLSA